MRLDVYFTPNERKPTDTVGRLVVIVDVLRASTTVATALGNGAKTVIPLAGGLFLCLIPAPQNKTRGGEHLPLRSLSSFLTKGELHGNGRNCWPPDRQR